MRHLHKRKCTQDDEITDDKKRQRMDSRVQTRSRRQQGKGMNENDSATQSNTASDTSARFNAMTPTNKLKQKKPHGKREEQLMKHGLRPQKVGPLDTLLSLKPCDSSEDDLRPHNHFDDVLIHEKTTYFRSNLKSVISELRSLKFKRGHIESIQKTPFWLLFDAIYSTDIRTLKRNCTKCEQDIRGVMHCYDTRSKQFMIAGQLLQIESMDVQLILGVTGGSLEIPLSNSKYIIQPWVLRIFERTSEEKGTAGKYQLYKSYIMDRLRVAVESDTEEGCADVARLIHIYLISALLAPTRNGSCNWYLTSYCENLEDLYRYNWSAFVVDMLMDQLRRTENMMAAGCTMLLPYWLCEHTSLIDPCEEVRVPRFLRWNLKKLTDRIRYTDLSTIREKYLRRKTLIPNSKEQKTFGTLKEKWDRNYDRLIKNSAKKRGYNNGSRCSKKSKESVQEKVCRDEEEVDTIRLGSSDRLEKVIYESRKSQSVCPHLCTKKKQILGQAAENENVTDKENGVSNVSETSIAEADAETPIAEANAHLLGEDTDALQGDEVVMNTSDNEETEKRTHSVVRYDTDVNGGTTTHFAETPLGIGAVNLLKALAGNSEHEKTKATEIEVKQSIGEKGKCVEVAFEVQSSQIKRGSNIDLSMPNFDLGLPCTPAEGPSKGGIIDEVNGIDNMNNKAIDSSPTRMLKDVSVNTDEDTIGHLKNMIEERDAKISELTHMLKIKEDEYTKVVVELKQSLRSSNNKLEAMEKSGKIVQIRKIEEAVKYDRVSRDAEYEKIYKRQQDAVTKLRRENAGLIEHINTLLNPTESQIVANEANIRYIDAIADLHTSLQKNRKLEEENKDLTETIELMEVLATENSQGHGTTSTSSEKMVDGYEDGDEGQNSGIHHGGGSELLDKEANYHESEDGNLDTIDGVEKDDEENSPSSMIQRIKSRTLTMDRKIVKGKPESLPIIDLDNYSDDYFTASKHRPATRGVRKVPLHTKYKAVKALNEGIKDRLQELWATNQGRSVVLSYGGKLDLEVTLEDILMLLHDARVSGMVVDSWGKMLIEKYSNHPGALRTTIFLSTAWNCVHLYGDPTKSKWLYDTVDSRIEAEVGKNFVLLFPMVTTGEGRFEHGDHWTLLKFNLVTCEWTFYNSLEPRTQHNDDVHLRRSFPLVRYVEKKIKEVFKTKFPNHQIHGILTSGATRADCPQQSAGTLDCGIVLCNIMEKIVKREDVMRYRYKHSEASAYRAKLVEWFVKPENVVG